MSKPTKVTSPHSSFVSRRRSPQRLSSRRSQLSTEHPTIAILALVAIMWLATFRIAASNRKELATLREQRETSRASYEAVIERLCGAVGIHDEINDREAQRISRLASILVRQMRVPTEQVKIVEQAAALRDVGKQGVAQQVLDKREAFDERDWAEMKRHPEIGYQMLKEVSFLSEVADVVQGAS